VSNPQKAKGSAWERAVLETLRAAEIVAERIPAGATLDRGDLWLPHLPITIDAKNHRTPQLGPWVDRATEQARHAARPVGLVWHKRSGMTSPLDAFVTTSGRMMIELLAYVR
jgi:hypothetical protein